MIEAKESEHVSKNGFDSNKNICKGRSQKNTSTLHSAHAGLIGDTLDKSKKALGSALNHGNAPDRVEVECKVSDEKEKSPAQKPSKPEKSDDDHPPRNLKKDDKGNESHETQTGSNQSETQQKSLTQTGEDNKSKTPSLSPTSKGDTEAIAKHQADVSMSNEENDKNSWKLREETPNPAKEEEKQPSKALQEIAKDSCTKDEQMLTELRRLVSNPTPGMESNFNNKIRQVAPHFERYKALTEKEISLASNSNDPLKHEDLKEDIKRARFIKLQAEKKNKLCPTIFDAAMSAPSVGKGKAQKGKTQKLPTKLRQQVSDSPSVG